MAEYQKWNQFLDNHKYAEWVRLSRVELYKELHNASILIAEANADKKAETASKIYSA